MPLNKNTTYHPPPPPPCFGISFTLKDVPEKDQRDEAFIFSQICWGTGASPRSPPAPYKWQESGRESASGPLPPPPPLFPRRHYPWTKSPPPPCRRNACTW